MISTGQVADTGFPLPESETQSGSSRRHRLSKPVVIVGATGVYTARTTRVTVKNPSGRMMVSLSFGWNPIGSNPFDSPPVGVWTATLTAWDLFGKDKGFYLPTNNVLPGPAVLPIVLPWTYETQTMVPRLDALVTVPNAPGIPGNKTGTLWATATWEPESGAIVSDEELSAIFSKCDLDVDAINVSVTGA